MMDSLASEVKSGHMAGPIHPYAAIGVKINGFMAVPKPSGDRRQVRNCFKIKVYNPKNLQVGNMSSPKGASFNEGVPASLLDQWQVVQTTACNFSDTLARAGRSCIVAKSDMVAAYKGMKITQPLFLPLLDIFSNSCLLESEKAPVLQVLRSIVPGLETHIRGQGRLYVFRQNAFLYHYLHGLAKGPLASRSQGQSYR